MAEHRRELGAVIWLESKRLLGARSTPIALGIFVLLLVLGQWLHWRSLPPRPTGDRLFGYAYLSAAVLLLHSGLAIDRRHGSEGLLVYNLVNPNRYFYGKVIALAMTILGLGAFAFTTTILVTFGEFSYTLWYSLYFTLIAALFLPLLVLIELLLDTRYPGLALFALFVITLLIISVTIELGVVVDLLGLNTRRFEFSSLIPISWRIPAGWILLPPLYQLWLWRMASDSQKGRAKAP